MKLKLPERRRFVRLEVPVEVTVFREGGAEKLKVRNLSPVGFMIESPDMFEEGITLPFTIDLRSGVSPVKIRGKVIWKSRVSLEDGAPYEIGIDIEEIEDAGKNNFLEYLCDLLYVSEYKERT